MPGYLIRRLSEDERKAIRFLSINDFASMRVDPWQI
jgi:hypothetical protein